MDVIAAIKKVSPKCRAIYLDGFANAALFEQYGINNPLRWTNFICQVMGETGGGTIVQESGSYRAPRILEIFGVGHHSAGVTPAEATRLAGDGPALFDRVYGLGNPSKARELGNTKVGDGWKFRGIGPLQSTGRGAAKRWGVRCNADFETDPLLMVAPKYIMLPPLLEWQAGNLNVAADADDTRRIRRVINGGYNGMTDVQAWHDKLWPLLQHVPAEAIKPSWAVAHPSNTTEALQVSLNALGYQPKLTTDGRYGPSTRKAVSWFQKANGLRVDGAAGDVTNAMIAVRLGSRHVAEGEKAA